MIDLGLDGARAVVIGAGFIPSRAGHGRGSALQLAAAGATVACVDMDEGRANEIVEEILKAGGKAFPVVGDVRSEAEAKRIVDEAVAGLRGIDVLVNVVGEASFDRSDRQTEEDRDDQMLKNLKQFFFVVKGVAPYFIEQGTGGSICTVASVDGIGSSRFHLAYGAAKAGVISLVKTYSDELGNTGFGSTVLPRAMSGMVCGTGRTCRLVKTSSTRWLRRVRWMSPMAYCSSPRR